MGKEKMKNKRVLLYEILWNQILWLIPVLLVMLIPVWFLVYFGILWFTRHGFWLELLLISLGFLALAVGVLFTIRYFRMPKVNQSCREKAKQEVKKFIKEFDYETLSLSNTSRISQELKNLNTRVARCFGIRSRNPEMDIPLNYILRAGSKISTDLEQYVEQGTLLNLASEWVSLNHVLWFIPSGKSSKQKPQKSQNIQKKETNQEPGFISSLINWGLNKTTIKPLFTRLFELVGENSIAIYSGDFTPYQERTEREKSNISSLFTEKFRRQNVFYHSRIWTFPLLATLYAIILISGLSVGGVFYSRDLLTSLQATPTVEETTKTTPSQASAPAWHKKLLRKHLPACTAIFAGIGLISIWLTFRMKIPTLTVEPNPAWSTRDVKIFTKVQNHINDFSLKDLQNEQFMGSIREIVDWVDCSYNQSEKPGYKIKLSDLLTAQRLLIAKAQRKIEKELPLIAYLRPADIYWGLWLNGWYQWAYKLYQKILWFDPISATVLQLKLKLNQKMLGVFSRELVNSYKVYALELVALLVQELYSRHLFYEPISILTIGHQNSDYQKLGMRLSMAPEAEMKSVLWKSFHRAWNAPEKTWWDWLRFRTPTLEENLEAFLKDSVSEVKNADVILIPASAESETMIVEQEERILKEIGKNATSEEKPPLLIRFFTSETQTPISSFGWVVLCGSPEDFWRFIEENSEKIAERQRFRYQRDANHENMD